MSSYSEWYGIGAGDAKAERRQQARLQAYAQQMDQVDRANAMSVINRILGIGAGAGTSSVSGMGLSGIEGRLAQLLDNPDSIKNSAAYQFRVGQGQEALQRSLGAKGLLNSGNRLTELTKYGQDMGSQEYDNQFRRLSDLFGGYQNSQANIIGSLANMAGKGAIGSGGTSDIYNNLNTRMITNAGMSNAQTAADAAMWTAVIRR